jgi:hypothetical protein
MINDSEKKGHPSHEIAAKLQIEVGACLKFLLSIPYLTTLLDSSPFSTHLSFVFSFSACVSIQFRVSHPVFRMDLEGFRHEGPIIVTGLRGEYSLPSVGAVAAFQLKKPLSPSFNFFEVLIVDAGESACIGVGLAPPSYPLSHHPGWDHGSIAYHADDGRLFCQNGAGTSISLTITCFLVHSYTPDIVSLLPCLLNPFRDAIWRCMHLRGQNGLWD